MSKLPVVEGRHHPIGCGLPEAAYCGALDELLLDTDHSDVPSAVSSALRFTARTLEVPVVGLVGKPIGEWMWRQDELTRVVSLQAPPDLGPASHEWTSRGYTFHAWGATHHNEEVLHAVGSIAGTVVGLAEAMSAERRLSEQQTVEIGLLKGLLSVVEGTGDDVFGAILDACSDMMESPHLAIWLVNDRDQTLTLRAQRGAEGLALKTTLEVANSLTGTALGGEGVLHYPDLSAPDAQAVFQSPEKAAALGLKSAILVPIRGAVDSDPASIDAVLAIYHGDEEYAFDPQHLELLSTEMAAVLEVSKAKRRERILGQLTSAARRSKDVSSYLHRAARAVAAFLHVEGVSFWLWNEIGEWLELGNSTAMNSTVPRSERRIELGGSLTGEAFLSEETFFSSALPGQFEAGALQYPEATRHPPSNLMAISMRGLDADERDLRPLGVIRCVNRVGWITGDLEAFSQRDEEELSYVVEVMAPYIQLLQAERRRVAILRRVSHEIQMPIVSIGGTASVMKMHGEGLETNEALSMADDIETQSNLLKMLTDGVNLTTGLTTLREARVQLVKEVVDPCLDMCKPLARDRGLRFDNIRLLSGPEVSLMADQTALRQIAFNLLTNGIKYSDPTDKEGFSIDLEIDVSPAGLMVSFEDRGLGIEDSIADRIFEYGFRGPEVVRTEVRGIGLGLYIARTLARQMGGDVILASQGDPTRFEVHLPRRKLIQVRSR